MSTRQALLPVAVPLLRPVADEWEWQAAAYCRTMDPDLFFHPDQERGEARRRREAHAKQICHQCPVMAECAAFSLRAPEPWGIWGGMSETERLAVVHIRNPRAAAVMMTANRRNARQINLCRARPQPPERDDLRA